MTITERSRPGGDTFVISLVAQLARGRSWRRAWVRQARPQYRCMRRSSILVRRTATLLRYQYDIGGRWTDLKWSIEWSYEYSSSADLWGIFGGRMLCILLDSLLGANRAHRDEDPDPGEDPGRGDEQVTQEKRLGNPDRGRTFTRLLSMRRSSSYGATATATVAAAKIIGPSTLRSSNCPAAMESPTVPDRSRSGERPPRGALRFR
jgi:hypothetical protein